MSEGIFFTLLKVAFFLICFCTLLYLTCNEIIRYRNNEDTSSILYREFNSSPRDKYPVITLCFYGRYGRYSTIYKEDILEKNGISVSQYWNMITGNANATPVEIDSLPEFSSVTIKLEELVKRFEITNDKNELVNKWDLEDWNKPPSANNSLIPIINSSYWPFYVSYQNPNQVCYSQDVQFEENFIKMIDRISMDTKLLNSLSNSGFLYLYVHHPLHAIRNFGKDVYEILLNKYNTDQRIVIRISAVSVLRRRPDAKMPCDPNLENVDVSFRKNVMIKVGCIPPYWKAFNDSTTGLPVCVTENQLKDAYKYSHYGNLKYILNENDPPCTDMTVSSSVDMSYSKDLDLVFQHRSDEYLETINKRDFGIENLWSSVGGFVGIFLGFSLFQLVEVMIDRFCWFKDNCIQYRRSLVT